MRNSVAVYNRGIDYRRPSTENRMVLTGPASLPLADGSEYRGPLGQLFATALTGPDDDGRATRPKVKPRRRADLRFASHWGD
jgi:hypothetical protein